MLAVARIDPQLLAAHQLTLLAVAPTIWDAIDVDPAVRRSFDFSREGNPKSWTLRTAHGLVDFIAAFAARFADRPLGIHFHDVERADSLDREFIAVLQRRADPGQLQVTIDLAGMTTATQEAFSPDALMEASNYGMRMAYYECALEAALEGRKLGSSSPHHAGFTRNMLFALLLLKRYDDVEALCRETATSGDPALLIHTTYAQAILNARYYDRRRHDYDAARVWVAESLAFAGQLPTAESRAFNRGFLLNTMALVEMRKGNLTVALGLLNEGLGFMAENAPGHYAEGGTILLRNRARLHVARKLPNQAVEDLTRVLELDPSDSEAYLDRGLLHQRGGRYDLALGDYTAAIRWSAPYAESHFNRAQTLVALGRYAAGLADYDRVLVLEPDHLGARINRACLHFEQGRNEAAQRDVENGLGKSPHNAPLLCLRGLLEMGQGRLSAAERSFADAASAEPDFADAWANRATVRYRLGDLEGAWSDIDRALSLRDDPAIRHNRDRISAKRRRPMPQSPA
ncbi:MAG TPA: tetratricopeptide repeat protein [Dongiaceae bacterium]